MSIEYPHHDQGLTLSERIHATVTEKPLISLERHIHFTALLTATLVHNGILSESQVLDLLDKVVTGEAI